MFIDSLSKTANKNHLSLLLADSGNLCVKDFFFLNRFLQYQNKIGDRFPLLPQKIPGTSNVSKTANMFLLSHKFHGISVSKSVNIVLHLKKY